MLVDAGDLLGGRPDSLRHRTVFEAIARLNYDAMTVGEQELIEGPKFLRMRLREFKFPIVSANMTLDGVTWPAYRVIKRQGLRIAVIGLTSPQTFTLFPMESQAGLVLKDPVSTLRTMLPSVRRAADCVVLLSHAGYDRDLELAKQVVGIDMIIGAHSQTLVQDPTRVGQTLVVQAGKNGEYVGVLRLYFDRKNRLIRSAGELIALTPDIPDHSTMTPVIASYKDALRAAIQARVATAIPTYYYRGTPQCARCHEPQFTQWSETLHAHALGTLIAIKKDDDPECLHCHTTGYGEPTGFVSPVATPSLGGVGCEICHRVTNDHEQERGTRTVAHVTEHFCKGCHNELQNPDFSYVTFLPKIRH